MARASPEELRLDYEDYLRQRELPMWEPDHPAPMRFKAKRCSSLQDVRTWVEEEKGEQKHTDKQRRTGTSTKDRSKKQSSVSVGAVRVGPCPILLWWPMPRFRLNLCCYLLDRQLEAQAKVFETEGGFTERLYRVRSTKRKS